MQILRFFGFFLRYSYLKTTTTFLLLGLLFKIERDNVMSKSYAYAYKEKTGSIDFAVSGGGEIDSSQYSLLELLGDEAFQYTDFDQRVAILDSWTKDLSWQKSPIHRKVMKSSCGPEVQIENPYTSEIETVINFTSNDYLNLTTHPRVLAASHNAIDQFGAGAGASPASTGTSTIHQQLEFEIAKLKHCEAAAVQSCGYATNLGVMKALLRKNDVVLYDMFSHASLLDGIHGTDITNVFFKHNDMANLESMLKRAKNDYTNKLIVVEGVYSMDGDVAPLDKIVGLAKHYGAWVLVDEAHATGVLGAHGTGTPEYFGVEGQIDIITGTFSKAMGSVGGFVAGSQKLINYLRCANRSFIFSTAGFTSSMAAALEAVYIIREEAQLREKLWNNINYFTSEVKNMGYDIGPTNSAIIPVHVGEIQKTYQLASALQQRGILVMPVIYPVVPKNKARIRLSLCALHSKAQLDKTLRALNELGKELEII